MYEGVTRKVIDAVLKVKFRDLKREDVEKMKLVLLDSIGCALGSYVVDRARLAIELVEETGAFPQASIIGGRRTSYGLAAFANGELINALDYDILGPLTGHAVPYVMPPCLAAAERMHASGKEVITALILALEVGGRMDSSLAQLKVPKKEPPYFESPVRNSYARTIFGGVAGAGKLIGLDANQMANAFGIAGASCPVPAGVKWWHIDGPAVMIKYGAWSGWTAQLATVAPLLAEKGFTGDTTILDGELGFWQIVGSPFFKPENLLGGLGEVWHISDIAFKPYPVCQCNHASIEAITGIINENKIAPEDITSILIKGDPLLLTPNRTTTKVETFADMQFSNVNVAAAAAFNGNNPGPAWQMPAVYDNPKIKKLAKRVKVVTHPRAEKLLADKLKQGKFPTFQNTIVEIVANGKKYVKEVIAPKGTPDNLMTEAELVTKFKANASFSMIKSSRVDEIVSLVLGLEKLDDYCKLASLLTVS